MKYCNRCGAQNLDLAVFCEKCGTQLTVVEQANYYGPHSVKPKYDKGVIIGIVGGIVFFLMLIMLFIFLAVKGKQINDATMAANPAITLLPSDSDEDTHVNGSSSPESDTNQGTGSASGSSNVSIQPHENFEMSNYLFDFTVKLDEDVFRLPVTLEVFQSYGWEPYEEISGTFSSGQGNYFTFTRDDKIATVYLANMSDEPRYISKATVCGFMNLYDDPEYALMELPRGIKIGSALDDVLEAYGEPYNTYGEEEDFNFIHLSYFYEEDGDVDFYRAIYIEVDAGSKMVSEITVENCIQIDSDTISDAAEISNEVTEREKQYQAPTELGNDLSSFNVEIDGDLYRFPIPVSAFLENGWEFGYKSNESLPESMQDHGYILQKGDDSLIVALYNFGENHMSIERCFVVQLDSIGFDNIRLPGGITIGTQESTFLEMYGGLFEKDDSDGMYDKYYRYYPDANNYYRNIIVCVSIDGINKDKVSSIKIMHVD